MSSDVGRWSSRSQIGVSRTSLTTTLAPSWAKRSAIARPRPEAAPVTIAVRPCKRIVDPSELDEAMADVLVVRHERAAVLRDQDVVGDAEPGELPGLFLA